VLDHLGRQQRVVRGDDEDLLAGCVRQAVGDAAARRIEGGAAGQAAVREGRAQLGHAVENAWVIDADDDAADAGRGFQAADHAQQHGDARHVEQGVVARGVGRGQRVGEGVGGAPASRQHQCRECRRRVSHTPSSVPASGGPRVRGSPRLYPHGPESQAGAVDRRSAACHHRRTPFEEDSMSSVYRIFGAEVSPYSVKVRSYFRYKGIPHEWIVRGPAAQAEYEKYAKLPLIPAVATPEDEGLQDSTPIIETLEAKFPEPSIHPADPALAFLSALIEEFGDEWGNKWMFHYRWAREADQNSAGRRIAETMAPAGTGDEQLAEIAGMIVKRMLSRVWFVGSSEQTAPQIEQSFRDAIGQLDAHLAIRPYLFGARPAFGDFGLWGQIYNAWTDPTAGALLRERAPSVAVWVERMLDPTSEGDFDSWSDLEPTLMPLLAGTVGGLFLPWSDANAAALAAGAEEFTAELASGSWTQKPQKYHARSLRALRERYAAVVDKAALDPILEKAGCLRWLAAGD
jgi:glutathione S-transferase